MPVHTEEPEVKMWWVLSARRKGSDFCRWEISLGCILVIAFGRWEAENPMKRFKAGKLSRQVGGSFRVDGVGNR